MAQLAEQLICNQQVIGSSPIIGLDIIAGWSSLEARRAHNPKVTGSNPVPAIEEKAIDQESQGLFLFCFRIFCHAVFFLSYNTLYSSAEKEFFHAVHTFM